MQKRDIIEAKQSEIQIYDKAISEIESTFGHIIFTPALYTSASEHQVRR